jgi:hypothetical protein
MKLDKENIEWFFWQQTWGYHLKDLGKTLFIKDTLSNDISNLRLIVTIKCYDTIENNGQFKMSSTKPKSVKIYPYSLTETSVKDKHDIFLECIERFLVHELKLKLD